MLCQVPHPTATPSPTCSHILLSFTPAFVRGGLKEYFSSIQYPSDSMDEYEPTLRLCGWNGFPCYGWDRIIMPSLHTLRSPFLRPIILHDNIKEPLKQEDRPTKNNTGINHFSQRLGGLVIKLKWLNPLIRIWLRFKLKTGSFEWCFCFTSGHHCFLNQAVLETIWSFGERNVTSF